MTTEREILEIAKSQLGSGFHLKIEKANQLARKINEDIASHWDDWVKESNDLNLPNAEPNMTLVATIMSITANSFIERNIEYEKYLKWCSDIFELTKEHTDNLKKLPN